MPHTTPPHDDCMHFATLLRESLDRAGLSDPEQIGRLVADAQLSPERESAPYHPAVVISWLQGTATPTPQAFDALHAMLEDVAPPNFEDVYEAAYLRASKVNELGIVLRHRMHENELSLAGLSQKLHEVGIDGPTGNPLTKVSISQWCRGNNGIPRPTLAALDRLLPPAREGRVTLGRIDELEKLSSGSKHEPSERLAKAAQTSDLHAALRYMRQALGFTNRQMTAAINAHLPGNAHVSRTSVTYWEKYAHREHSHVPSSLGFGDRHPIDVYLEIMTDHGLGEWALSHREQLHRVYHQATLGRSRPELFSFSEREQTRQPLHAEATR